MTGWLGSYEDAAEETWVSDPYWVKANERAGHVTHIKYKTFIGKCFDPMRFVRPIDIVQQIFYGNPREREGDVAGLASRYSSRDPQAAHSAMMVFDAGGRSSPVDRLSSVWVVGWGPESVFLVTPDGEPYLHAGEIGLVVKDFRYVARIANVDRKVSAGDLRAYLDRALLVMPSNPLRLRKHHETLRQVIYLNGDIAKALGSVSHRGVTCRVISLRSDEARVP